MLRQTRQFTRGWFAIGLLVLLAAAFTMWGVTGAFNGVGAANVAKVGDRTISPAQLSRELEAYMRRARQEGQNMSQEEAVEQGLHLRLLDSLIQRNAFYDYADKLGVTASDAQVANMIRRIPLVQNPLTGTFDQGSYTQFLRDFRYTQPEFEAEMRNDITSEMLRHAMSIGVRAPASFGALVLAFQSETRTVTIAEAPASLVGEIPAPTAAQIQTFYEDNAAALQMPEYRALTIVRARAADFAARVDVPEQRLREEFEARRESLSTPEKRTYVRLAAQNQQQGQEAVARLARGETAQAVAQALSMQVTRGENQTREQVVDDTVAQAVFSMNPSDAARAVPASLSPFAVVKVESVTPGAAPTFENTRTQLHDEIAAGEAGELLNAAVTSFEDARAAGANIADAARAAGLGVATVEAVDAEGRGRDGQPIPGLSDQRELLGMAFETAEGEASDFTPSGDADIVVSVDRVIPAAARPLDEVRPQLVANLITRERVRRLNELGTEVQEAVRGGQSFTAAARAHRMTIVVTSRPLDRQAAAQQLPARRLGGALFGAAEGDVVSDIRADGGALLVAQVERINRADPAQSAQLIEAARQQVQQALQGSLTEAVAATAVEDAHPRRNERTIQQMYPSAPGAEDESGGDTPAPETAG